MVLDDDADTLDMMHETLSYEGFEVCCQSDTDNVIQLVQRYQPDILLIDYLLHGINGGELCSIVKKDAGTGQLPVIIISAYPRVINSLGLYGCDVFMAKPFDLNALVRHINELTRSVENPIANSDIN